MNDPPPKFLLHAVRLENYRSIAECTVLLDEGLTLLVGPNGSGKSNFLDALRFVAEALHTSLDHALRERGGIGEVRRRGAGRPPNVSVRLVFLREGGRGFSGTYEFALASRAGGGYRVVYERCDGGDGLKFQVENGELVAPARATMPPPSDDRLYLVAAAGLDAFRGIYDALQDMNVYNVNPDAMRRPQPPDPGDLLRRDGANIAGVLRRVSHEAPDVKRRIEAYLRAIVGDLEGVDQVSAGSFETLEFRQRRPEVTAALRFSGAAVSDGTLRALGVLTAMFAGHVGLPSPIGIEEPEAALHPAAVGVLVDALLDASDSRQVLVTTHSADLLEHPAIHEPAIRAVRLHDGATKIGALDASGREALREDLYTPGELLRIDQLAPAETTTAGEG